jgi:hypothetical protein
VKHEPRERAPVRADSRPGSSGVGLLNEKPLHAGLKLWCAEEGSASKLRRKISALLRRHRVRLVLPVASRKTVVRVDDDGAERSRRPSPRHATALDAFRQLVGLGDLLGDSNLAIDIVLVHEEEVRRASGRRKGFTVGERRLLGVEGCVSLDHPADYLGILPSTLKDDFTTADLARALRQPRWMAQKIAYVLRTIGVLRTVGKAGNASVYRRGSGLSDRGDPSTISK